MKFTDIFIRRPVLSTVVSLLILILGIASYFTLPLSQYPAISSTTITITTTYPGASANLVKGFITTPLSQAIGSADGIDYLTSTTTSGLSVITAYIKLNYDPGDALTNVTSEVNSVANQLPTDATLPKIQEESGDTFPIMFLGFSSDSMTPEQISAYLTNVAMPKVYSVGGISALQLWGGKDYAMRIWLDTNRMSTLGITPDDVKNALTSNSLISAPGQLQGKYDLLNLETNTTLHTADQFNELVVKTINGRLIRIKDIGNAELGSKDYTTQAELNGKPAVFLTVQLTPSANPLDVVNKIRDLLPSITKALPSGLKMDVTYDATTYVRASIKEVMLTILEAIAIVVCIIFLFLGSLRAVVIPIISIPLSLFGACFLMNLMGFSINLLTLLAMVLAVGLVVDDAIVVLENIYRHLEEGLAPFEAALVGAREIAVPVIVMVLTLVAVFAPVGFIGGVTGSLFLEFAFTVVAAVVISGVIALTFSPMLTSKLINRAVLEKPLAHKVNQIFSWFQDKYKNTLHHALNYRGAILCIAVIILISCYFMFMMIPSELAPQEDQGILKVAANAPVTATLDYLKNSGTQLNNIFNAIPEKQSSYLVYGFPSQNIILGGVNLKPWGERSRTEMQMVPGLQQQVNAIPGLQSKVFEMPPLPGTPFGPPVNFVLKSTAGYSSLFDAAQNLINTAQKSGLFLAVISSLQFNNPQINITIDRSKAADLGITMSTIGNALSTVIGDGFVNYFTAQDYAYEVIPQAIQTDRYNLNNINSIRIPTSSGSMIPLSSIIKMDYSTEPSELDQFQQLNAITIQGVLAPGVTLGQALTYLSQTANTTLPSDISYDYGGASRQFMQEGQTIMYAFALAIIIVILLLAGRFESFRDPFIILIAVPMSIFGALLPLFFGAGTLNIYSEIGLITLIGLISKHGILMVDFANTLQEEGLNVREAIEKAASIRLRPILMTTAAIVFGVTPLIIATGAGAVGRNDIGIVVGFGMLIGTCFTLFMVPTLYLFISKPRGQVKQQPMATPDGESE